MKRTLALTLAMLLLTAGTALAAVGGVPEDMPGSCGHFHKNTSQIVLCTNATETTHQMVVCVREDCELCGLRVSTKTVYAPEEAHVSDGRIYVARSDGRCECYLRCAVCGSRYMVKSITGIGQTRLMPETAQE